MKNKNYICNTDLASNENKDCTVRALAQSLTGDYEKAHAILKKFGRQEKQGVWGWTLEREMLPSLGFVRMTDEELVNPGNTRKGKYTANSFIKDHVGKDTGYNYYLITRTHAIGVTSEGISDVKNFVGRARLESAWKIKK